MRTLGIIPARGGSKGCPRKNIRTLGGLPLIAYTIQAAQRSGCIDRLVVSTEDEQIADIAESYGAEIPCLRPYELARDDVDILAVIRHMVNYLEEEGDRFDIICVLYATSPFRDEEDIREAMELFLSSDAEVLLSVGEVTHGHPYWCWNMDPSGRLSPFIEQDTVYYQRQLLPRVYEPNGAIYLIRREAFPRLDKLLHTDNMIGYLMDEIGSLDINTELDFLIAETIMEKGVKRKKLVYG